MYYLHKFDNIPELKQAIDNYQIPVEVRTTALKTEVNVQQYPIKENKKITVYYQQLEEKALNITT